MKFTNTNQKWVDKIESYSDISSASVVASSINNRQSLKINKDFSQNSSNEQNFSYDSLD